MCIPHPLEHPFVVHQRSGADTAREHHDVGVGELLEGRVDGDAEHAVLAADLAAVVADERDVDRRYALQHLVWPDGIECGEPGKQWYRDLHGDSPF
jgi:hypothetical protein